jgi:hypothetical protein
MKKNLNITSLLLGAALGVIATLTIAAAASSSSTLPYGRFQLIATDNYVFKIDTTTGQVWRSFASSTASDFMKPNLVESGSGN